MTKRKTESQIVAILKEADAGVSVQDICRQHGVAPLTFYKWREKQERRRKNGGKESETINFK